MTSLQLLWTIQLLPLAAFLLIQVMPKPARRIAPAVGILFALGAALASLKLFSIHAADGTAIHTRVDWLYVTETASVSAGFLGDSFSLLMIVIVTVIAFFVQMFSYYYMAEDPSRPRYFGFLSFFSFSMTGLVLSSNLLQTFVFWELVGLTSYLLIGFWVEKKSAGDAARKAFVLNRLADLGFYLGIILLFLNFGTLDFVNFSKDNLTGALSPELLTLIGILVFTGVMGKSAQFPFHVWLPDAMEGPTPVSALIHSATMVAAGVFLLVRAFGLFAASATVLDVVLVTGTLTAVTGALLATRQRDIKKILAYSTVSQLGLMVMAIGSGGPVEGMFHLTTHAFFKSLLFLTSGMFIHLFHTNDIWEMAKGGAKKKLLPMAALAFGLLSLSGIPPFAGFFSKDLVLEAIKHHSLFYYGVSLFVSFITAYYSFRLFFILLFSKEAHHPHHDKHGHHTSAVQSLCGALPLISLAALSLVAGYLGTKPGHFFLLHWLGGHDAHFNMELFVTTMALVATAAVIAFIGFRNPEAAEARLNGKRGPLATAIDNKFYIDDAYEFLVKKIGLGMAAAFNWFDKTVANEILVNRTSFKILDLGKTLSRLQSGYLQDYLALSVGVGVILIFFILR